MLSAGYFCGVALRQVEGEGARSGVEVVVMAYRQPGREPWDALQRGEVSLDQVGECMGSIGLIGSVNRPRQTPTNSTRGRGSIDVHSGVGNFLNGTTPSQDMVAVVIL